MPLRWTGRTVATATVLLIAAIVVLYALDPTRQRLTPPCPYLTLTGLACPGCGLARALHFLLHGDIATAFAYNPWAFVGAPAVLAFALLPSVTDEARTLRLRSGISWVMLVVTLAFWVWRNTAAYPFMRV
ncbi:DUF2752 domain-containing protein [Luteitalea sp.]